MNNEYNYRLQLELPGVEFDDDVAAALDDLADFVAEGHDGEGIQDEIYETARRHDLEVSELFKAGYRLFFDKTQGPRIGEFLGELERDFVVQRLHQEGWMSRNCSLDDSGDSMRTKTPGRTNAREPMT